MIAEDIELDYSIKGDAVVRTLIGGLLILVFESIIVFGLTSDLNVFNDIMISNPQIIAVIIFSPLIIPFVLIQGYIIDIFKSTKKHNNKPPEFKFEKVKQYLKDGISGTIIFFFHALSVSIPLSYIVLSYTSHETILSLFFNQPVSRPESLTIFLLLMLVVAIITFIYTLLTVPASFGIYTYYNSIISALSPSEISQITFSKEYIIAVLITIIVTIIVFALSSIMYFLNGGLFDVFIKFIALIFTIRIFSLATDKQLTK